MKTYLFATVVSLATLFGVGQVFAHDDVSAKASSRLSLSGQGKVNVEPDVGYINFGVVTDAETATEALAANEKAMSKVFHSLKALGIEKKEIRTSDFSLTRKYKYEKDKEPVETGYVVGNVVNVTVCDLSKMGKVLDSVVKDGVNRVNHVSFGVKDSESLKDQARKLAIADALRKAKLYGDGAGFRIVRVVSLSESSGDYNPRVYYAAEAARAAPGGRGDVSVSGGSINLTVNVSVVWEIAPAHKWGKCDDCNKRNKGVLENK